MKESNELFELCRQVYEVTEWDGEELDHWQERPGGDGMMMLDVMSYEPGVAPLYTSDYLLERLPSRIQDENGNYFSLMGFPNGVQPWFAYKGGLDGEDSRWPIDKGIPYYQRVFQANTPLKALLKLTLKLHEEEIL